MVVTTRLVLPYRLIADRTSYRNIPSDFDSIKRPGSRQPIPFNSHGIDTDQQLRCACSESSRRKTQMRASGSSCDNYRLRQRNGSDQATHDGPKPVTRMRILNFTQQNVERMHHYQRGRTSITGLRFWLRKVISTKRLVVVVMSRLVRHLLESRVT